MTSHDVRWIQRFSNFKKALLRLKEAVEIANSRELSRLEKEGLVKTFEYTQELAWLVMKDYLLYQGINNITGSRDAIREAFANELISDGNNWIDTIRSRNLTSHTYNEEVAEEILTKTIDIYYPLFLQFESKMESLQG
ncbi:MAG: nucleotidyltransferase [Melioribacteraceae bacterium]|nr:MAG: nucleotidyltransferase [Melioribacteraceae bacterium]